MYAEEYFVSNVYIDGNVYFPFPSHMAWDPRVMSKPDFYKKSLNLYKSYLVFHIIKYYLHLTQFIIKYFFYLYSFRSWKMATSFSKKEK